LVLAFKLKVTAEFWQVVCLKTICVGMLFNNALIDLWLFLNLRECIIILNLKLGVKRLIAS